MNNIHLRIDQHFEKLTSIATALLGNSIVFILAFLLVVFWWTIDFFSDATMHQIVGDFIFGTTFLSLFIIQKSNNRFSAILHLKLNELIASHEPASNSVIHAEEKSEREIIELAKEYAEIEQIIKEDLEES